MPAASWAARRILRLRDLNQKPALTHDLLFVLRALEPDVEVQPHHVDVSRRSPLRARVLAIRVPERNVDARELLVLQDVADHMRYADVGADSKLTHPVRVLIAMRVLPELVLQLAIAGGA